MERNHKNFTVLNNYKISLEFHGMESHDYPKEYYTRLAKYLNEKVTSFCETFKALPNKDISFYFVDEAFNYQGETNTAFRTDGVEFFITDIIIYDNSTTIFINDKSK